MWKYAYKCCIFHLINYLKMLAPCGLKLHFYIFFMDHVQKKNHKYQSQDQKQIWTIFLSTHTPIKHCSKTPFMENLKPMWQKNNIRIAKFSNSQIKMKLKIKIFPCKLYAFNIDVCFKHQNTSCTLLKIVYIIQYNYLNNFIFICMVKEKTTKQWFQFLNIYNEF